MCVYLSVHIPIARSPEDFLRPKRVGRRGREAEPEAEGRVPLEPEPPHERIIHHGQAGSVGSDSLVGFSLNEDQHERTNAAAKNGTEQQTADGGGS